MKKALSILLAAVMLVSMLAGCGGDGTSASNPPASDPTTSGTPSAPSNAPIQNVGEEPEGIVPGTVINLSWESDKQTHLPYTSDSHGTLYLMMYDTLFETQDGETKGLIAKDWTVSEDGMQYVINIHDDIYFCLRDGSQGNHVTADTVVRSLELTKKYMSNYFVGIESIEATGEYEITVTFNAPYPDFTVQFSQIFTGIVDPDYVAEHGEESNDSAIGTGPYYLVEYQGGEKFVFKANPNYWNEDHFAHIETVNALIIPELATNQVAIKTDDIDWFETGDMSIVNALTADENITSYVVQGAFNPLYFNCNREPFDDPNVRRGIGLLINAQNLVDIAYGGEGKIVDCAWSDKALTYAPVEGANEYNPEEGLRLLEEAGVDPSKLVINTYCSYLNASYMPALQAELQQYGITLNFETYEVGTFVQSVGQGDWDVMAWFGMLTAVAPYQTYLNMYGENGFFRALFIEDTYPELWQQVQDLLAEAGTKTDLQEQAEVLKQIDQLLAENYIWQTNVEGYEWKVYDSKLQNMRVDDFFNFTLVHELYWAE